MILFADKSGDDALFCRAQDGRDPLFTRVADAWMQHIIAEFGSDHA